MVFPYDIDVGRRLVRITLSGTVEGKDIGDTIQAIFRDPNFRPDFDEIWDGRTITSLHLDINDQPNFLKLERQHSPASGAGRDILLMTREVDLQACHVYAMRVRAAGGPRQVHVVRTEQEAERIVNGPRND